MAITAYRPTTDLFRTIFDDLPGAAGGWGGRLSGMPFIRTPDADVWETKEHILVAMELPGLRPENLELSLENNLLTISGEKREERNEGNGETRWHLSERRYGRFSRSFVLPKDVDQDQIKATFEHGVLSVSIPKSERAKPRRIEIRHGNESHRIDASREG
jgi:HSP20 family protein